MQATNLRVPALIVTILAGIMCAATVIAGLSLTIWLVSYTQMVESPVMLAVTGIASLVSYVIALPSIRRQQRCHLGFQH